jgi:uncharacterized integral membrane protein
MLRIISAVILLVLLLIFIIQNSQQVTLNFLLWQFRGSLALILLITFIVAIIISLLIAIPIAFKRWRDKNDLKESEIKQKEIDNNI